MRVTEADVRERVFRIETERALEVRYGGRHLGGVECLESLRRPSVKARRLSDGRLPSPEAAEQLGQPAVGGRGPGAPGSGAMSHNR